MKNKVISVLLCAVLCFGFATASLSRVAFASVAEAVENIDIISSIFDYCKSAWEFIKNNFGYDEAVFKGMSKLEVRSRLLVEFKKYSSSFSDTSSKDDVKRIVNLWSLQDYETIANEYGRELSSYCSTNSSNFFDYYHAVMYYFDGLDDFIDSLYSDLSGYTVNDDGDPQIPIEDFKQEIIKQNNTIAPKNPNMVKYSFRDLSPVQENADFGRYARCVYTDGKSVVGTNLEEGIYVQPYAIRSGYIYYTPYQYHLYRRMLPITVELGEDADGNAVYGYQYEWKMDCIYYERFEDGESVDTFTVDFGITADRYEGGKILSGGFENMSMGTDCSIGFSDFYGFPILGYETRGNCFKNVSYISNLYCGGQVNIDNRVSSLFKSCGGFYLRSDDVSDKIPEQVVRPHFIYGKLGLWNGAFNIDYHDESQCDDTVKHTCDAGLYVSATSFSVKYAFDTTRIPSNTTVTISGDSVYDYSITDNTTGDTTTIYNYVTNNYTYPEKDDTSEPNTSETSKPSDNTSSGNIGGTVGGNVTVGGTVRVDGQINVSIPDINININQNGGTTGGVGESLGDYIDVDTSEVDDDFEHYLGLIPKASKSFIDYMKDFFSWLPKEVYGLLIFGIVVVVIQLILKFRR